MKVSLRELQAEYSSALHNYIVNPHESALHRGYELGRRALDNGVGVLEMAALYHKALLTLLPGQPTLREEIGVVRASENFFIESLAPFEMTHRGIRDANHAWRQLNERLEEEAKRIAYTLHEETGQFVACAHLALHELGRDVSPSHPSLRELKNLLATPVGFTSGFGTAFPLIRDMLSGSRPKPRANLYICSMALSAILRQGFTIG